MKRGKRVGVLAIVVVTIWWLPAPALGERAPTKGERSAITQATIAAMEAAQNRPVPSFSAKIERVAVSTVTTPSGYFIRYAVADVYDPSIGGAAVFLGFRRGYWHVLTFGSSDVGCGYPQNYLAGQRDAILRDLRLTCH